MSFVRPEATARIARWREALIGCAALLLGLYWVLAHPFGILHWLGYLVALAGTALIYTGIQRARFRQGGGGPGVVQINEGRVAYFGPLTGGVVDLADLNALELDPSLTPAHWVLRQPAQPALAIPLNAEGAETLFDAFATLPGLRTEYMLRQIETLPDHAVVIWRRPSTSAQVPRLH